MSVQTLLAAGFLFLGGALLQIVNILDSSDWRFLFSLLFMLMGAIPLVIQLARAWLSWYQKFPDSSTDNPTKED